MSNAMKRVVVTGGAGQIAYNLLFRIASGEIFGKDVPVALHLLDLPAMTGALEGVVMELHDCGFELLKEIRYGSDPLKMFEDVDVALLVGSKPRGPGMERKDLLADNGKIFVSQGEALNSVAKKEVIVFVVGNPCNTNCLIAMHHAPGIPRTQFFAMTTLDQNRARFQLAHKAGVDITAVDGVTIWGNHSATQVPDFINATIDGRPVTEVIEDRKWLEETFIPTVQKRGAAVISARGKSSAASAANGVIDGMRSIVTPTPHGKRFSSGVVSDGNPYGVKEGLIFSFPCVTGADGKVSIQGGLEVDPFLEEKIALTERELLEERECVAHLLK